VCGCAGAVNRLPKISAGDASQADVVAVLRSAIRRIYQPVGQLWLVTMACRPERIAGWERAIAEIRASNGRLPPRA
jgi:hypothetical protein